MATGGQGNRWPQAVEVRVWRRHLAVNRRRFWSRRRRRRRRDKIWQYLAWRNAGRPVRFSRKCDLIPGRCNNRVSRRSGRSRVSQTQINTHTHTHTETSTYSCVIAIARATRWKIVTLPAARASCRRDTSRDRSTCENRLDSSINGQSVIVSVGDLLTNVDDRENAVVALSASSSSSEVNLVSNALLIYGAE